MPSGSPPRENFRPRRRSGQTTIEFVLTMIFVMAFTLFFVQITLVFGFGNFAHYATFMSARALLSAGRDLGDQRERAKAVATALLTKGGRDRFPAIARGQGGSDPPGLEIVTQIDPGNVWRRGVRYTFRSRLFLVPLAGNRGPTGARAANQVTLTSESWLGVEPSYSECTLYMSREGQNALWDNGC